MRNEYKGLAAVLGAGLAFGAAGAFLSSPLLLLPAIGLPIAGGVLLARANRAEEAAAQRLSETSGQLAEATERLSVLERRMGCDSTDIYFSHLIHGGFYRREQDILHEGEQLGFTFPSRRFVVLVAHLERWGNVVSTDGRDLDDAETVRRTFFVLRNVMSELLNEKNCQYDAEVDGEHVCLVSAMQADDAELSAEVRCCAQRAVELLENELNISVTVAVSQIREGFFSLPQCYTECKQLLDFQRLAELDLQVITCSDVRTDDLVPQPVNFARLQAQLLSCIRASDYEGAKAAVRFFCTEEAAGFLPDVNSLRFRLFGAINTLLAVLDEQKTSFGEEFFSSLNLPDSLLSCQTLSDVLEQSDRIFDQMIAEAETGRRESAPQWVEAMRQYIDENYTDPNLSVYGAADKFSISASHCSRVFKQHVGMGALEYIQRKRLEHAKSLMGQGLSVKQIAEASGFSNGLMMNRAFKRFEGTTPSKFQGGGQ